MSVSPTTCVLPVVLESWTVPSWILGKPRTGLLRHGAILIVYNIIATVLSNIQRNCRCGMHDLHRRSLMVRYLWHATWQKLWENCLVA